MANLNERMNARDRMVRDTIIKHLIDTGYGTYAQRLKDFEFIVSDFDQRSGHKVETAQMDSEGTITINPGFFVLDPGVSPEAAQEKMLDQLSVLIRHEMLHYLLAHILRMMDYIKRKFPNAVVNKEGINIKDLTPEEKIDFITMQEVDNTAADWELSKKGYDAHDKEVVKNMTLCGEVIGGLILEEQRPDLLNLTYEELLDKLIEEKRAEVKQAMDEYEKHKNDPKQEIHIDEISHSQEYTDIYNKVMELYDDENFSDKDLEDILNELSQTGEINL